MSTTKYCEQYGHTPGCYFHEWMFVAKIKIIECLCDVPVVLLIVFGSLQRQKCKGNQLWLNLYIHVNIQSLVI